MGWGRGGEGTREEERKVEKSGKREVGEGGKEEREKANGYGDVGLRHEHHICTSHSGPHGHVPGRIGASHAAQYHDGLLWRSLVVPFWYPSGTFWGLN
eukprot:2354956-Rhodomonas_salina.2